MAILWCGGEDIDFPNGSPIDVDSSSGGWRAGYARCGIAPSGAGAVMKSTLFPGGAVSSFWLTFRATWLSVGSAAQAVGPQLSSAGKGLLIASDASEVLTLYKFDSTIPSLTSIATESGQSFTSAILHRLDMQVTNWGTSATVNVYLDGVLRITFTGDISFSGTVTGADSIFGRSGNVYMHSSEIIVADTDTRLLSLITLAPAGAGTTDQWTGAYTDVNDIAINDSNVVYTDTVTQDEQFSLNALPSGTFQILAVREAARASITTGATPTKVALGINSGGTVSAGTLQGQTTAWTTVERLMLVNPVTSAAFTQAEINALQVNLRSGS